MANLVMDFLQGIAKPFETLGKAAANVPEAVYREVQNKPINDIQQRVFGTTNQGQIAKDIIGSTAQVGADIAAPVVGKAAASATGLADAGGVVGGAAKGAVEGAAIGGTQGAAQGVSSDKPLNAKNLGMDFIQGAGEGAALGGAVGGAIPAVKAGMENAQPLNEAGGLNNPIPKPSDQFAPEDLQKMADSKTTDFQIQKTLEPITGKVIAQEIAPTIGKTEDPNIVGNIIDNAVNKKVAPVTPEVAAQSPAPTPLPAPTPTSNINTPAQVAGQSAEEASLFAAQPEPDFLNAPGEEPAASHTTKAGALSGMQDILNSGGTTDEALNHYFENVPNAAPGEAQEALDNVVNSAGVDKSKINSTLNPQYENVNFPEAKSKDAAVLNGQYANNKVIQAGRPAIDAMRQLDEHDLELTRSLKGRNPAEVISQAHNPEQFAKAVQSLKDYNDYTQAAGAQLGQDIPYRQNYGLRTPYAPPELPEGATPGAPNAVQPTNVSYTKQRLYNTHEEALANGEVPKNATALEDLQNDIGQRAHDHAQLALAQGLEQSYPGQVRVINQGAIPSGYRQLLIPGGDKIFMPNEIADQINERQMSQQATGALGKYDDVNAAGKNLELGGGLFHGTNTGGIFVGQQLTSGKLFSNPEAAGNVVKNMFSEDATKSYMNGLRQEGTFDEGHSVINAADAAGLNYSDASSDIGKPSDTGISGKVSSLPVLKQIHQAIFERQIPTMMMETFRQKTQGLDIFGNADDREQAIKIAKAINNEYGHLNRDIQGLTPKQFKLASRAVLATDYQEGQLRTLANAFTQGGEEGKLAREAVFGKALVFGGLATLGAEAGGDFKDQSPKQVALAIMNKAINPSFNIAGYRVGLPATQISNVAKPVEQSIASAQKGKGIAAGPENFFSSHAAFVPSKAEEFGTNKNFEGNAVYGKDYFGRPISAGTTAENVVSGVLPIPLAQTAQTATGNQSVGAAIANTVGLNASPQYNLNYAPIAGQTYVKQLEETPGVPKAKIEQTTEFFDLLGQAAKNKNKVITQAETAINKGDTNKANQVITDYNQKLIQALTPWAKQGGSQYLDSTMLSLLRTAELTYGKANRNLAYTNKTNPTSVGAQVKPLANQPQPVQ